MKKIVSMTVWLAAFAASLAAAPADSTAQGDSTFAFRYMLLDSNATRGSSYGSFADVLNEYPGVFHYDRGSVGQQALLSLYGGSSRHTMLYVDGMLLNDPITGLADFSLVPVEAIGHGRIHGHEIDLESSDIAAAPLRSRVAYRTGMSGYDDIDARLGARFSSRTTLNAGGVLRNYDGTTTANEKYRAQTINLIWRRQWFKQWQVSYRLLKNRLDRDIPLPAEIAWWPALQQPHEKLDRYDHGLVMEKNQRWRFSWQYTDLHHEWYGRYHSVVDHTMNAGRSIAGVRWQGQWRRARWQTDGAWIFTSADSRDWAKKLYKHDLQFHLQLQSPVTTGWYWQAGLQVEKRADYDVQLLPHIEVGKTFAESWRIKLWQSSSLYTAGLAGHYSQGPLMWGQADLKAERGDHMALAVERQHRNGSLFLSAGLWLQHHPIWCTYTPSDIAAMSPPYVDNDDVHRIWTSDAALEQNINQAFSIYIKASYRHADKIAFAPEPQLWARGYLQYHKIFFGSDLNTTLRLGGTMLSEREQSDLLNVDQSETYSVLPSGWVPYVHAIFIIKDVTLFFVMQNVLAAEYQIMNGYPMPQRQFRWGVVWNFFD